MLTVDDLKQGLPAHLRGAATQELTDKLNQVSLDPEVARAVRENFVSYSSVMNDGRFKIEDYLNAVAYVSHKMMGASNQDAYKRTFPGRYRNLVAMGKTDKEISAYVSHYNQNKLVNLVLEQSMIPAWILNQDVYQEAIRTQFELMQTANSEKVRAEAANSILTHLKRPEAKRIEIDLSPTANTGLDSLRDSMAQLAETQLELIRAGMSTREVAHYHLVKPLVEEAQVIEGEVSEISTS